MVKRHKVKSSEKGTTNSHEKGKDYLSDAEMKTFLEASKKQDTRKEIIFF